jgi:hypothetical protein
MGHQSRFKGHTVPGTLYDEDGKPVACTRCSTMIARKGSGLCLRCLNPNGWVCSDCHEEKPIDHFVVMKQPLSPTGVRREGRCRRCKCRDSRDFRRTEKGRWHYARNIAKQRARRGHLNGNGNFEITLEEYTELVSKPCHYCGWPLSPDGIGLDRLNDQLGYMLGNVVPCCPDCNLSRSNLFTPSEMLLIGSVVSQIKAARESRGEPVSIRTVGKHKRIYDY